MKLKIFSDRKYLPSGVEHAKMLQPFWGRNSEEGVGPWVGCYDRYMEQGRQIFEMTSLAQCDLAVVPAQLEDIVHNEPGQALTEQFLQLAEQHQKPTVGFFFSDSDEEIPWHNLNLFRPSLQRSKQKSREFAMPAWSEDFVTKYLSGQLIIREKSAKPSIGFCGVAQPLNTPPGDTVKTRLLKRLQSVKAKPAPPQNQTPGYAIRTQAMQQLLKHPELQTNFIVRERFLGSSILPNGKMDLNKSENVRSEFVRNIIESDYVLCAKGEGNYSYRFYETLSCGRIPIFIDTDCVLPYDFAVDWKEYCVWLREDEIDQIGNKVIEFHNRLSEQDFRDLQHECRKAWLQWICPEGFFQNFHRHFDGVDTHK